MSNDLGAFIQEHHPDLYAYLKQRDISGFVPDPIKSAEVLTRIKRNECRACNHPSAPLRCTGCRVARYCDAECQALDWNTHKEVCALDKHIAAALKEHAHSGHLDAVTTTTTTQS